MNHQLEPTIAEAPRAGPAQHSAHVISLSELHEHAEGGKEPVVSERANPLHQIRALLQVCVGEASVTVGELLTAKEHQVFLLNRSIDQPVEMLLHGKVVARGQLVAVDDQFAVRITELPVPLKT